jgi:hypothetical protein
VSALQVLERDYAEPVHPVDLLNAALATMWTATHESAAILPDIPSAEPQVSSRSASLVASRNHICRMRTHLGRRNLEIGDYG